MRNKTAGSRRSLRTQPIPRRAGGKRTKRGIVDGDEDEEGRKTGERKVCGSSVAKICGSLDFGWGTREWTRRYDLIKGSLLPGRDFPSRPVNESNFSSDFRLPRGFIRTRSYNAASTGRWAMYGEREKTEGRKEKRVGGKKRGEISRSLVGAKRITESSNRVSRPMFANPFFDISMSTTRAEKER